MRDNLKDALRLLEVGYKVLPLHSPNANGKCDCNNSKCASQGKHPRITDWTNAASGTASDLERWWGMWPHANVGVLTGPASGIVVVDVDPRHGGDETIEAWVNQHDALPWCPWVETGGGGMHFYLKHPGDKVLSRSIAPGIDIKGDGGQVVAPPSIHVTGGAYRWKPDYEPWLAPAGEIPDWLLEKMHDVIHEDGTFDAAAPLPERITEQHRNSTLASWAGTMRRRGASQSVMFKSLLAVNEEHCVPPLSHNEVAKIAASIARYVPQQDPPIIIDIGEARKKKRAAIQARTVKFSELELMEFPPRKMAVPGLMPVGLALLAGRLKLGKSWMMLGVGMAIALGDHALGKYPVERGDVLYIAYEDDERRIQKRARDLLAPGWPVNLEIAPSGCWPQRDQGGLETIDEWLKAHPDARMVIIDTLQRFRGGSGGEKDSNSYAADYQVSAEIQELAMQHEVVIVAIHHYRKSVSDVDWVDQISGTNGIAGAADVLMGFDRKRGDPDASLKATGRDLEQDVDWALVFDGARYGWVVNGTGEELRLTKEAQEFCAVVRRLGHGGAVHYRQIAEEMDKRRGTVHMMGQRLADRGYVLNLGGGMYKAVDAVDPYLNPSTETVNPVDDLYPQHPQPSTGPLSMDFESKNGSSTGSTAKNDPPTVMDHYRERLRRAREEVEAANGEDLRHEDPPVDGDGDV